MIRAQVIDSPVGPLTLAESDEGLVEIRFGEGRPGWTNVGSLRCEAADQLRSYFAGELREFDLPLAPRGSAFQLRVWRAVAEIPYGETRSYLGVARLLGDPAAVRAVGAANGRNPLPIVVPCHRVVGSDGSLTGYAGGVEKKRQLLAHEGQHAYGQVPLFGAPAPG